MSDSQTPPEEAASGRLTVIVALIIFISALLTRAALQIFGGDDIGDVSWVTTYAAIGAGWIGVGGQIVQLRARVRRVDQNTNGALTRKTEEIAHAAADAAVQRAIESPALPAVNDK